MNMTGATQPDPPRDPDLINAEIALRRAALRAREQARRTGTAVVYCEDGMIKVETPPASDARTAQK